VDVRGKEPKVDWRQLGVCGDCLPPRYALRQRTVLSHAVFIGGA
jgi:hypothetical protein